MPTAYLWYAGCAIVMGAAVWALLRFTRFGLATRACDENEKGASLLGYSPQRVALLNWVLSAVLAGLAGIIIIGLGALQVAQFSLLIVPALAAALVGNLTSIPLAVLGGFLIGVLQSGIVHLAEKDWWPDYLPSTGVRTFIPLLIVVLVLFFRGNALPVRGSIIERRQPIALEAQRPWVGADRCRADRSAVDVAHRTVGGLAHHDAGHRDVDAVVGRHRRVRRPDLARPDGPGRSRGLRRDQTGVGGLLGVIDPGRGARVAEPLGLPGWCWGRRGGGAPRRPAGAAHPRRAAGDRDDRRRRADQRPHPGEQEHLRRGGDDSDGRTAAPMVRGQRRSAGSRDQLERLLALHGVRRSDPSSCWASRWPTCAEAPPVADSSRSAPTSAPPPRSASTWPARSSSVRDRVVYRRHRRRPPGYRLAASGRVLPPVPRPGVFAVAYLGGITSVWGAVVGGPLVAGGLVSQFLSEVAGSDFRSYMSVIAAIGLILTAILNPEGIATGNALMVKHLWAKRRGREGRSAARENCRRPGPRHV